MKFQRLLHLVASGGNSAEYPENTLPAMRSAIDCGARFIQLDVQLSADGVTVVVRDHSLVRAASIAASVFELQADELVQVDVSERRRFGNRFHGTCIPRLSDAMHMFQQHPEITAFITIGHASVARFGRDPVVSQVLQVLRHYRSRCVVVSADMPAVHSAREMGECQVGWIVPSCDSHTRLKCEALQPDFLFYDSAQLTAADVLWRGPWRWVVNDVSSIEAALSYAERGADFIATSQVRAMSEAMRAHAKASSVTRPRPVLVGI